MDFSAELKFWYRQNARDLPWRHTTDPYKIWLSEIILQQTRVDQGMNYYYKFTENYPTVFDLAHASETQVLRDWQGLGYYSRARNLHTTAKLIVNEFGGKFPATYTALLQLKGVGEYTAAAISSICFREARPVVDGNVYRVLARFFGEATPIDSTLGKKRFRELAETLMDQAEPDVYNQAIMEFGARQCTPRNPNCGICPLAAPCIALKQKKIEVLPVKAGKTKVTERWMNYLILRHNNHLYIRQRTGNDIWKNLWEFPLLETTAATEPKALCKSQAWHTILNDIPFELISVSDEIKHILSHQKIWIRFYELELVKAIPKKQQQDWIRIQEEELNGYGFPIALHKYMIKKRNSV
ncbi:MAG: A/G-specific adenine glycosylase [Bacteroidia bacterium]